MNIQYIFNVLKSISLEDKTVVIESDDWGSQRIPSRQVGKILNAKALEVKNNPYLMYDTLENLDDLNHLEDLLIRIEKKFEKKVKITANFIMENPNYKKIRESKYQEYFGEIFTNAYFNRDSNDKVWRKIDDLVNRFYIKPQYHGREHVNVPIWLNELQKENKDLQDAFDLNCYSIDFKTKRNENLLSAFHYNNQSQKEYIIESITDGYRSFNKIFGFNSESIVIPRHVWNPELNNLFKHIGIKYIQTSSKQENFLNGKINTVSHYTGKVDKISGLKYLVRNIYFEPSYNRNFDWVNKSLEKIDLLFALKKPVIISMHRLNFVGGLVEQNRIENLKLFELLLEKIIVKYKDVKFESSDKLFAI